MQALQAWFFPFFHLRTSCGHSRGSPLGFFMWIRFYVSPTGLVIYFFLLRTACGYSRGSPLGFFFFMWKPCRLLLRSSCGYSRGSLAGFFFTHVEALQASFYSRGSLAGFFYSLWSLVGFFYSCASYLGFFCRKHSSPKGLNVNCLAFHARQFMKRFCKPVGLVCEIFLFYSRYLSSYWMLFSSRANSNSSLDVSFLWCASWFLTYSIRLFKAELL